MTARKFPPGRWRPTALRLAGKHCPRAVTFYEDEAPHDRRIFHTGTAAHAIIQVVIEATQAAGHMLADEDVEALSMGAAKLMIEQGRTFEGDREGPLPPDAVWRGREIARSYVARHPFEPAALVEVGLAVDGSWVPVAYDKAARFRAIADYLTVAEEIDEESAWRALRVVDYKSAWPTDRGELDTIQRRAQAVLAWLHHGEDVDVIVLCVANLRTGVSYEREIVLDEAGTALLERWRDEIEATCAALDAGRDSQGRYKLSPGGGCIECPWVGACKEGREWTEQALEGGSTEDRARALLALEGRRGALIRALKEELADRDGVEVAPGMEFGFWREDTWKASSAAAQTIAKEYLRRGGDTEGLLMALDPTAGQVRRIAAKLFPEREDAGIRNLWEMSILEKKPRRKFGLHRVEQDLLAALQASLEAPEGAKE